MVFLEFHSVYYKDNTYKEDYQNPYHLEINSIESVTQWNSETTKQVLCAIRTKSGESRNVLGSACSVMTRIRNAMPPC